MGLLIVCDGGTAWEGGMAKSSLGVLAITLAVFIVAQSSDAANWKRVAVTPSGTIVELDTDSVGRIGPDLYTVLITGEGGNQVMFLDCKGNYGNTGFVLSHIPAGSIAQAVERVACRAIAAKHWPPLR